MAKTTARFLTSASHVDQLPVTGMAEFGVIGRSNVGKSSLLNALFKSKGLVRTSSTPGRTQLLNLFSFEDKFAVTDLPGYGYAKLSKTARASLQAMIRGYITEREGLAGMLLLIDSRRDPVMQADVGMADWIVQAGQPVMVVATKVDLIPKNRRMGRIKSIEKQMGLDSGGALGFSAKTGEGRPELVASLFELC